MGKKKMRDFVRIGVEVPPEKVKNIVDNNPGHFVAFVSLNTKHISEIMPLDDGDPETRETTIIIMDNGNIYHSCDSFEDVQNAIVSDDDPWEEVI